MKMQQKRFHQGLLDPVTGNHVDDTNFPAGYQVEQILKHVGVLLLQVNSMMLINL